MRISRPAQPVFFIFSPLLRCAQAELPDRRTVCGGHLLTASHLEENSAKLVSSLQFEPLTLSSSRALRPSFQIFTLFLSFPCSTFPQETFSCPPPPLPLCHNLVNKKCHKFSSSFFFLYSGILLSPPTTNGGMQRWKLSRNTYTFAYTF